MDYEKLEGDVQSQLFQLAHLFPKYNLAMVDALAKFRAVKKGCIEIEENGKTISAVKADVLADASKEAADYELARAHVINIEMIVKCLSFQNENR